MLGRTQETQSNIKIHDLPVEIILHIFSFLDLNTLANLQLGNKRYKHISDATPFYKFGLFDPEDKNYLGVVRFADIKKLYKPEIFAIQKQREAIYKKQKKQKQRAEVFSCLYILGVVFCTPCMTIFSPCIAKGERKYNANYQQLINEFSELEKEENALFSQVNKIKKLSGKLLCELDVTSQSDRDEMKIQNLISLRPT
jgi:hypothetical protein